MCILQHQSKRNMKKKQKTRDSKSITAKFNDTEMSEVPGKQF